VVLAALVATEGLLPGGSAALLATAAALTAAVATLSLPRSARRVAVGLVLGAALLLGRLVTGWAPLVAGGALPDGSGPWTATIETVGTPRGGSQSAIAAVEPDGTRIALTLPRYPIVEPGHRVVVEGSLRPPPDDGYGAYLDRIGVVGTLRSRRLEVEGSSTTPTAAIERLRRDAGAALARALPEPEAGLAAGILIGLRDRVDREVAAEFTTAGVSHVVAISGWNIAIVAASVGALAGRLGRRRRSLVILAAIAAYVAFAGASPSVVRAGSMATVVLLARETGRRGQAAAALAWAVALLLLADPGLVRDAGFQLSAVATGGLLAWAAPIDARLRAFAGGRLPGWLVESLAVSLAAQAATLPVVLATFGRLSIVAPVVNLAVVPLVVPAMAGGGLALAAGVAGGLGLPTVAVAFIALPGWLALKGMVAVVDVAAGLPFASLTLPAAAAPLVGAAAGLGLFAIAIRPGTRRGRRHRDPACSGAASKPAKPARDPASGPLRPLALRLTIALLGIAVAVTTIGAARSPAGGARVTILDVGQGDAILVEGSAGGRLLIDGGPDPDRLVRALDARLPPWDRRIDVVVVTHPHEDHVAGIPLLLERYAVGRVLENGMGGTGPGFAALEAELEDGTPVRGLLAAGDRLRIDDVDLRVLWPGPGTVPDEPADSGSAINNLSIVLLGESSGRRFLLTGDAEEDVDRSLLAAGVGRLDLLKVAHHGSATASTSALLAATRPAVAAVSVGSDNPYGHPTASALSRLRDIGAAVYRTDIDGSVEVTLGANGLRVRTEHGRNAAAAAEPLTASAGEERRVGYHPADDGPRSDGRRRPPALPRSPTVAPPSRARRGRDRGVPRGADRRGRNAGRPGARRGGRAAPRRRQGAPGRRPRPPPASRGGLGRVADPPRPSGTGPGGRQPPGHLPARRGAVPALGDRRIARGADRRVCRQARRPAPRVDGRPIRVVESPLPRHVDARRGCRRPAPRRAPRGRRLRRGRR
jgi:competence protein ComEC